MSINVYCLYSSDENYEVPISLVYWKLHNHYYEKLEIKPEKIHTLQTYEVMNNRSQGPKLMKVVLYVFKVKDRDTTEDTFFSITSNHRATYDSKDHLNLNFENFPNHHFYFGLQFSYDSYSTWSVPPGRPLPNTLMEIKMYSKYCYENSDLDAFKALISQTNIKLKNQYHQEAKNGLLKWILEKNDNGKTINDDELILRTFFLTNFGLSEVFSYKDILQNTAEELIKKLEVYFEDSIKDKILFRFKRKIIKK